MTHTPQGAQILGNFLQGGVRLHGHVEARRFRPRDRRSAFAAASARDRVICGLSGGVDSSVVAALLAQAIGPQLSCILVDNGLLRKDEEERVIREFSNHFKTDLHVVKAEDKFLAALAGTTEPQEKRRIIGHAFIECFADEAAKIEGARFLAQGTLYPDVIESGGSPDGPAATIKLHHNVGGLPEGFGVRADRAAPRPVQGRGARVGPATRAAGGHRLAAPLPRSGLGGALHRRGDEAAARRVSARPTPSWSTKSSEAGLYRQTAQAFAVLLPVQSVGVMGDARTYADVVAVRSIDTEDFMTADWSHLPYELLARISTRIINEVKGVNRVVYDISSKPPATIEWE